MHLNSASPQSPIALIVGATLSQPLLSTSPPLSLPAGLASLLPDVTHRENREPGNGERTSKIGKDIGISLTTL